MRRQRFKVNRTDSIIGCPQKRKKTLSSQVNGDQVALQVGSPQPSNPVFREKKKTAIKFQGQKHFYELVRIKVGHGYPVIEYGVCSV